MRDASGEFLMINEGETFPPPTEPTEENVCLDIHNNVSFHQRCAYGPSTEN